MWDELSASEKSELMRIFIKSGIRDLGTMRDLYNEYRGGGSIHIKPENRGKFTALKKRTGKSASWFKAHGTPAQRKMATFALNARKWHHGEGGYLGDDDVEYFGGTLPGASVTAYLPDIQSKEGKAIAKNMAERVANGQLDLSNIPRRYYNYVRGEAEGAIPMRGYMDKATNVALGTLAVPLATMAAAEAAPVLAPGSALWSNPITQQMVASEIGGRAVDLVSKDFTGKTWAENMTSSFDKLTGLNSSDSFVGQSIAEMTNPGYLLSPSHFISKVGINRLQQAAFDSYANRLVKEGFTPSPSVATERPKLQQFPEVVKTTPKTVTDSKGNTWYEVDVPENYLDQEWQYTIKDAAKRLKSLPDMLMDPINKQGKINIDAYPEVKSFLRDIYLPILKQEGNLFNIKDDAKAILTDEFVDNIPIELKNRIAKFFKGTQGVSKNDVGFGGIELGMASNEKERLKDIIHELDHTYRRNLGRTSDMNYGLLYNGNEGGIPSKIARDMNNRFSVFKEGFQNKFGGADMNHELTATSSEIKMDLYLDYFDKNGKYPNAEQIKSYIDHLSDEEINNLFKTTNAYGKNIINQIDKFNSTNKESANQNLRWLLKNVAIIGIPFGIGAEMLNNQSWDFSK